MNFISNFQLKQNCLIEGNESTLTLVRPTASNTKDEKITFRSAELKIDTIKPRCLTNFIGEGSSTGLAITDSTSWHQIAGYSRYPFGCISLDWNKMEARLGIGQVEREECDRVECFKCQKPASTYPIHPTSYVDSHTPQLISLWDRKPSGDIVQ